MAAACGMRMENERKLERMNARSGEDDLVVDSYAILLLYWAGPTIQSGDRPADRLQDPQHPVYAHRQLRGRGHRCRADHQQDRRRPRVHQAGWGGGSIPPYFMYLSHTHRRLLSFSFSLYIYIYLSLFSLYSSCYFLIIRFSFET